MSAASGTKMAEVPQAVRDEWDAALDSYSLGLFTALEQHFGIAEKAGGDGWEDVPRDDKGQWTGDGSTKPKSSDAAHRAHITMLQRKLEGANPADRAKIQAKIDEHQRAIGQGGKPAAPAEKPAAEKPAEAKPAVSGHADIPPFTPYSPPKDKATLHREYDQWQQDTKRDYPGFQSTAIFDYDHWQADANSYLRAGKTPPDQYLHGLPNMPEHGVERPTLQGYVKALDTAMAHTDLAAQTVRRGLHDWSQLANKSEFTDRGFAPTTRDPDLARAFAYLHDRDNGQLEIRIPQGAHGIDRTGQGNSEVILPRGSSFKVTGVDRAKRILYVDLVKQ
jgi:hypothetical protein